MGLIETRASYTRPLQGTCYDVKYPYVIHNTITSMTNMMIDKPINFNTLRRFFMTMAIAGISKIIGQSYSDK